MTALGQAENPAEALTKVHHAHAKEEANYTATLKSEPNNANLYQQRGVVRFFSSNSPSRWPTSTSSSR